MTIQQMRQLYNQGKPITAILAAAGLDDADPAEWRKILSAKRSKRGHRRSTSRRQPTAAETLSRITAQATAELVDRVNRKAQAPAAPVAYDIPFMGEPCGDDNATEEWLPEVMW